MSLIVIIIVLLLLFGGGGFWYSNRSGSVAPGVVPGPTPFVGSNFVGILLMVLVIMLVVYLVRGYY